MQELKKYLKFVGQLGNWMCAMTIELNPTCQDSVEEIKK